MRWRLITVVAMAAVADGAKAMPSDGKPEHELPFTPEGRAAFMANKPTYGFTAVPSALTNDPMPGCDPQGFPRIALHNAHTELQSPSFEIPEQECVPSETAKYNRLFGNPAAGVDDAGK